MPWFDHMWSPSSSTSHGCMEKAFQLPASVLTSRNPRSAPNPRGFDSASANPPKLAFAGPLAADPDAPQNSDRTETPMVYCARSSLSLPARYRRTATPPHLNRIVTGDYVKTRTTSQFKWISATRFGAAGPPPRTRLNSFCQLRPRVGRGDPSIFFSSSAASPDTPEEGEEFRPTRGSSAQTDRPFPIRRKSGREVEDASALGDEAFAWLARQDGVSTSASSQLLRSDRRPHAGDDRFSLRQAFQDAAPPRTERLQTLAKDIRRSFRAALAACPTARPSVLGLRRVLVPPGSGFVPPPGYFVRG